MPVTAERVNELRAFNRFHTNVIGALQGGLVQTPYTLTEARVLFELAQVPSTEVRSLRSTLDIDAGYLSRILARFAADGLIHRQRSPDDGRRQVIALTAAGEHEFGTVDRGAARAAAELLGRLTEPEQRRLLDAMDTVRALLGGPPRPDQGPDQREVTVRAPEPGDYGWIVQRHGELYAAEYGWNTDFETLVARIVADYLDGPDPRWNQTWIAERNGERLGCICCAQRDADTAQLRVLLVEPQARGTGLGGRLVDECLAFASAAGYRRIVLWTYDVLTAARRIYQRAGFTLVEERPEHAYGHDLVGQFWARDLPV